MRQLPGLCAAVVVPGLARARAVFPTRAIRIVVPFQAGGLTDALARLYAESFSRMFNQSSVVENRPGAGGVVASRQVAKAAPDGHTILFGFSGSLWPSRILYQNLGFDPDKDLAPLAITPLGATVFGVPAESSSLTFGAFVERFKVRSATIGVVGAGSSGHILASFLNRKYSTRLTPIFYKGEAPMWTDLASGHIDSALGSLHGFEPFAKQGRVRPIGFRGASSLPQYPGVASFEAQGFKESTVRLDSKYVICVPSETPREIQDTLAVAIRRAEETPQVKDLRKLTGSLDGHVYGADESRQRWMIEVPIWVDAVSRLGIIAD